jgi:hypothetical protein
MHAIENHAAGRPERRSGGHEADDEKGRRRQQQRATSAERDVDSLDASPFNQST